MNKNTKNKLRRKERREFKQFVTDRALINLNGVKNAPATIQREMADPADVTLQMGADHTQAPLISQDSFGADIIEEELKATYIS